MLSRTTELKSHMPQTMSRTDRQYIRIKIASKAMLYLEFGSRPKLYAPGCLQEPNIRVRPFPTLSLFTTLHPKLRRLPRPLIPIWQTLMPRFTQRSTSCVPDDNRDYRLKFGHRPAFKYLTMHYLAVSFVTFNDPVHLSQYCNLAALALLT